MPIQPFGSAPTYITALPFDGRMLGATSTFKPPSRLHGDGRHDGRASRNLLLRPFSSVANFAARLASCPAHGIVCATGAARVC
jgi:hypothetical protein